jgi:hypothetical protein
VLCVKLCFEFDGWHHLDFVGVPDNTILGYLAACFRKVDEIRLCVEASKAVEKAAGVQV